MRAFAFTKFVGVAVAAVFCGMVWMGCGGDDPGGDDSHKLTTSTALRAQPVAAVPTGSEPEVLYSWTDKSRNYYIINVGHIKNTLLMERGFHYSGVGHMGISTTETVESSIAENRTHTVSNSVVVSTGSYISTTNTVGLRDAITAGVTTGIETGGQTGGITGLFVKGSVKASVEATVSATTEASMETSHEISGSFETSTGRTTETSASFETTLRQSWATSTVLAANSGDPAGWYRYAWYVVSDVYFVISTSLDNQELLSWEVVSVPREKYELHQEYSSEKFDNSPKIGDEIVFSEDFWKRLPQPNEEIMPATCTITLNSNGGSVIPTSLTATAGQTFAELSFPTPIRADCTFLGWYSADTGGIKYEDTRIVMGNMTLFARWLRSITTTMSFTTDDTYTLPNDVIFPAEIEVYALGAGGGGQGGNRRFQAWPWSDNIGSGASGGGGAAVYGKFTITQPTSFIITVGASGDGGRGVYTGFYWDPIAPGAAGGSGENTTVIWGGSTITAGGGSGGGISGGRNAGLGGTAGSKPDIISEENWAINNGSNGLSGSSDSNVTNNGGNAGGLTIGSIATFGGGIGGSRNGSPAQTGSGGNGGYNDNQAGSSGGNGEVRIVVTYTEIL